MTREEAITVFKAFMDNPLFSDVHKAAFNIAINDIKQRHDWDINNLILINKDNYESQEPKTGHWIEQIDYEENCRTLICSNCDRPALHDEDSIWKHKFCPHCGAKMVEPQETETWNGIHAQITAPKGTFERIFNDADDDNDI